MLDASNSAAELSHQPISTLDEVTPDTAVACCQFFAENESSPRGLYQVIASWGFPCLSILGPRHIICPVQIIA